MANLKIISDSQCDIYIDGDFISNIGPNKLEKVSLEVGEYWIQIVCCSDINKKHEEIVNLQCDKVVKVEFQTPSQKSEPETLDKAQSLEYNDKILESIEEKKVGIQAIVEKASLSGEEPEKVPLLIVKKDKKIAIYDYNEKSYISNWYDKIGFPHNGYRIIKTNGKFGILDSNGRETIPCKYSWIDEIINNNLITVKENGKYGIVDVHGKTIIPPVCEHDYDICFSDGLASIVRDGKYGYIDLSGEIVIPCKYDNAYFFK